MAAETLDKIRELQKLRRISFLLSKKWDCGIPGCDGKPGHRMPEYGNLVMPFAHARAEQTPPQVDWHVWLLMTGRGFGKLVLLSTMIPTPSGWTTMAQLRVGDYVFDHAGQPTTVLAVYDSMPERAYRLTFSDGTTLDAGGEHQWVTWDGKARKAYNRNLHTDSLQGYDADWPAWRAGGRWGTRVDGQGPQLRVTDDLFASQAVGPRGDTNHSIPCALPLDLPSADLPMDPWQLGYWLGNGTTRGGEVSTHDDDEAWVRSRYGRSGPRRASRSATFTVYGLVKALRRVGVLGDKHVPAAYLRASIDQRRALLAGLLDSDGHMSKTSGHVEFGSTTKALAEAVVELARSLGQKPVIAEGIAKLNGVEHGPKWRVTWRPTVNPFTSPRKSAAFRPLGAQALRNFHRMVVSVTPIPVEPMRCITVDSPHSLYLAGEGMIPTHNTRTGAQFVAKRMLSDPGHRAAIIVPTFAVGRDVCIEGESGLRGNVENQGAIPWDRIKGWNRNTGELVLTNGSRAKIFGTNAQPDAEVIRGEQFGTGWFEELATQRYGAVAWDMLEFALRLGTDPKIVVTTTPRKVALLRRLLKDAEAGRGVIVTRGSTLANRDNLPQATVDRLVQRYEGTTLGRQELYGELLEDEPGALWTQDMIDNDRAEGYPDSFDRIVVAIDPAGGHRKDNDETGIMVEGIANGHVYPLEDLSGRHTPDAWARAAMGAYERWAADCVVGEQNYGGDMVETTLRTHGRTVRYRSVTASRGKVLRAEPIVGLYERHLVHHVGVFAELETQMTTWVPPGQVEMDERTGLSTPLPASNWSPDRLDAHVWAVTSLTTKHLRTMSA